MLHRGLGIAGMTGPRGAHQSVWALFDLMRVEFELWVRGLGNPEGNNESVVFETGCAKEIVKQRQRK